MVMSCRCVSDGEQMIYFFSCIKAKNIYFRIYTHFLNVYFTDI